MPWLQFEICVARQDAERVETVLCDAGALAVSFADGDDSPIYQAGITEPQLWNMTRVRGLLPSDAHIDGLRTALLTELGLQTLPEHRISELEEREWTREWLKDFKPMRFGKRLWVCPSVLEPPEPTANNIRLDPGLAFGTGTHATTALCLEWLDANDINGKSVIDFGCGSGILAIAAARLDAASVWAVDLDPQALAATRENARRNQVLEGLEVCLPGDMPALQADVLLANNLSGPLLELAPRFAGLLRPGGTLLLSGILSSQQEEVRTAYAAEFRFYYVVHRQEWLRMDGLRLKDG